MIVLFGVLAHMVVLFLIFWGMSILFSIVVGSLWKFLIFVSIWFYPKSQYKVSGTGIKVTITYSNNYASFLFHPLLLLPSIFPSITIFSNESVLWIRWQRIGVSASAENSNEFLGLKGITEDEIIGWHHQLNGHEFEQALGVGDGQGSLACCSPWVAKSQTWQSNWTDPCQFPTSSAPQVKPWTRVTLVQVGRVLQCKTPEMKSGSLYRLQVALSLSMVVNLCSLVICISLECK